MALLFAESSTSDAGRVERVSVADEGGRVVFPKPRIPVRTSRIHVFVTSSSTTVSAGELSQPWRDTDIWTGVSGALCQYGTPLRCAALLRTSSPLRRRASRLPWTLWPLGWTPRTLPARELATRRRSAVERPPLPREPFSARFLALAVAPSVLSSNSSVPAANASPNMAANQDDASTASSPSPRRPWSGRGDPCTHP